MLILLILILRRYWESRRGSRRRQGTGCGVNVIEVARWGGAIALVLGFVFLVFVQPVLVFAEIRRIILRGEDRGISQILILGSLLGITSVLVAPISSLGERAIWAWVPIALEAASIGMQYVVARWTGIGAAHAKLKANRSSR
jgi:hypothetical protein